MLLYLFECLIFQHTFSHYKYYINLSIRFEYTTYAVTFKSLIFTVFHFYLDVFFSCSSNSRDSGYLQDVSKCLFVRNVTIVANVIVLNAIFHIKLCTYDINRKKPKENSINRLHVYTYIRIFHIAVFGGLRSLRYQ